jgi:thiol-disulfide isomerase/thioredoxin
MKNSLLPVLSLSLVAAAATQGYAQTQPAPEAPATAPATSPAPNTPAATPTATPAAPSTNTEALKVVADSVTAYKALKSLSSKVTLTDTQGNKKTSLTGIFWYARPNKGKLELTDGKSIYRAYVDGKTYTRQTNPKNYSAVNIPAGMKSAGQVWAGAPSFGGNFLTSFLDGENILAQEPFKDAEYTLASVDGVDRVSGPFPLGPQVTAQLQLDFDHTDHLLRNIQVNLEFRGKKYLNLTSFTDVQVNPTVVPGTFTYKPAPGVHKITKEEAESYWDPRLKKGAKPFPISAKDLNGKLRTLTQYKGKVLLVDFWATWCGPCVAEIPNVLSVYKKYHGKGFEILGVSLDQNKSDLTSFIKAQGVTWPQIFTGEGPKDPVANAYGIQAIPFTMLVGKDGKIVDVNLRGEALEKAVKQAVAAK